MVTEKTLNKYVKFKDLSYYDELLKAYIEDNNSNSIIKVEASSDGFGNYSALDIEKIEDYKKDDVIVFIPSENCTGSTRLNINNLGNKSLMKIANDGTLIDIETNDLIANHEYYFRYNGSVFVWQIGTSAEQLNYLATEDSTLKSTNVKDAIEELDNKLEILNKTRGYHTPQLQTDANELVDSGKYVGFGNNFPDDEVWMVDVTASSRSYVDDITQEEITDIYIVQQAYKVCDVEGNRVEPIGKTRTCVNGEWSTWNEVVLDDGKFNCIPDITVQGRTLVNLLGRSGNAIYQQDWTVSSTTITYTNDTFVFSGDGSVSKDINTVSGNSYLVGYIRNGVYENNIIVASATTTTVSISVSDGDVLSYIRVYQIESTETIENYTNEKYPYVDDVKCVVNPYFECDNSRIMFETKLYEGETITRRNDGTYVKNSEWGEIDLIDFYNKNIIFHYDYNNDNNTCNIHIRQNDLPCKFKEIYVVGYNGEILKPHVVSEYQGYGFCCDEINMRFDIPNSLTGWGKDYTPTQEEIKAFFLGWRMYESVYDVNINSSPKSALYNGTGIKCWRKIYCGVGTYNTGTTDGITWEDLGVKVVTASNVGVCPTVMNDQGYTPYRLIYKKETSTVEEVKTYGGLVVKDGVDITSGSGLVLGEHYTPSDSSGAIPSINVFTRYRIGGFGKVEKYDGTILSPIVYKRQDANIILYGDHFLVGLEYVEHLVDYFIYQPDTVTSYDYTITYDNSIKSILNKTQNELITTKNELINTKKELEHAKHDLSQKINPNLLINGDFQVWQRGASLRYDESTYRKFISDRWCLLEAQDFSNPTRLLCEKYTEDTSFPSCMKLKITNAGAVYLRQCLEYNIIQGRTVTLSFMIRGVMNSEIESTICDNQNTKTTLTGNWQKVVITCRNFDSNNKHPFIEPIRTVSASGEYYITNVKLELGEYATPFVPQNYGEELLLSQRYYQIHSTNTISNIDLRPSMRVTPTITPITGGYAYDAEIY